MSLKSYLSQFTRDQLIKQILELHKKYKDVQTYYEFSLNPDSSAQAEKVKQKIHKLFDNGYDDPKLRESRAEISAFKKLSPSAEALADVMLWYVECGVEFTNNYGDINEAFYNSVEKMFEDVCKFIRANRLNDIFKTRCETVVNNTEGIGWGFHDELGSIYWQYFEE